MSRRSGKAEKSRRPGRGPGEAILGTSLRPVGDSAWLLEEPDPEALQKAYERLVEASRTGASLPGVRDLVPAAASVLVILEAGATLSRLDILAALEGPEEATHQDLPAARRTLEVRVRYGGADLPLVASHAGLTEEEVVKRYSSAEYTVAFVGFQPGFPYLRGLPLELSTPRRASPRPIVPGKSVAIGAGWTGIYPADGPGGWNLIGTARDVVLFDPRNDPPSFFRHGDRVRFVSL